MKKLFFFLALSLTIQLVQAQSYAVQVSNTIEPTEDKMELLWDKTAYDFGEIPQNIPATTEFVLTNTTDRPLIITKVKGSCGCTATAYDEEPIPAGEQSIIKATYNAKKEGAFIKYVKVTTSTSDKPIELKLTGTVVKE